MTTTEILALKFGAQPAHALTIENTMILYGIVDPLEKAYYLAQWAHETQGFKYAREIWGPTAAQKGYEGRADLGNDVPGDGKRYMGRGDCQLTGKNNYRAYSRYKFGDDRLLLQPQLVEQLPLRADVAAWYWCIYRPRCRITAMADNLDANTRLINGGINGIEDRAEKLDICKRGYGLIP